MKKKLASDKSQIDSPPVSNTFISPGQQRLIKRLVAAIEKRRVIITLTGASGLGKSFLMEQVFVRFAKRYRVIKIQRSDMEYCDIFDAIARLANIDISKQATVPDKGAYLISELRSLPDPHVIIQIDQAHSLKPVAIKTLLDWVKIIAIENRSENSVQLVLLGLPALNHQLNHANVQQLNTGIGSFCQLKPLSDEEIAPYTDAYLKQTDAGKHTFEAAALQKIAHYSQGSPRIINKLCDLSLVTANLDQNDTVSVAVIDEVAENCELTQVIVTQEIPEISPHITTPLSSPVEHSAEKISPKASAVAAEIDQLSAPVVKMSSLLYGILIGLLISAVCYLLFLKDHGDADDKSSIVDTPVSSVQQLEPIELVSEVKPPKAEVALPVTEPVIDQHAEQTAQSEQATLRTEETTLEVPDMSVEQALAIGSTNAPDLETHIETLLQRAQRQIKIKQLMTPEDKNALQTYQSVLELEPDNQQALQGIQTIAKTYILWAEVEIKKGNMQHAKYLFNKALQVAPDNKKAQLALQELERQFE